MRSIALSAPQVSGCRPGDFEHVHVQLRALRELQRVEAQLFRKTGEDGVLLLRDVLGRGNAAKERGEGDAPRVSRWGGPFSAACGTGRDYRVRGEKCVRQPAPRICDALNTRSNTASGAIS